MYSSSFINPHSIRTFIKYFLAIIALLLAIAPAGAQAEPLSPPSNVRFSADGRTVSWDPPTGLVGHYRIHYGWTKGEIGELHDIPLGNVTSFRIPDFDPSATWQARVRAMHAVDYRLHSWYGPWEYWHPPTPTPSPTPTATPSASYLSRHYENRTVYEEQSCADRREFRRCSRYCLDADPGQCWGKTCGPWLVGVAAEPSCATPEGAPTATATLAPSGSVSCENEVVAGKNTFNCAFTLHNSRVAYQAVGWMDQPEAEYPFFSYYESEDGMLSRTLFPEDCGQTLSGRAIAFAVTLEYLATVDFSHEAICSLPTDTPVPPTDTPTPEPPTDTPIPPTDTPTPVPPTDTPTPEPSGSVSCANAVSANRVTCTFSLEHYALEFARVDWSDRGTGHAFIGNVETADGIFSADIAPGDCGKTIEGRAVALDSADVQLAAVDFSHALVCPIPTDTPVPPTDTPTPIPPTDTPTPEPRGSVSCVNALSANQVTCAFSLEHYALEFARVDWSDRGTGHAFIGNVETADGYSARI